MITITLSQARGLAVDAQLLHGNQLIGRLDPKMDRKTKTLYINAVFVEPDMQLRAGMETAVSPPTDNYPSSFFS